jgi:hypothetical protein
LGFARENWEHAELHGIAIAGFGEAAVNEKAQTRYVYK